MKLDTFMVGALSAALASQLGPCPWWVISLMALLVCYQWATQNGGKRKSNEITA